MARTILLRHAEAQAQPAGHDVDRPLTPRGRQEAREIGAWLVGIGWVPDAAVASPARRAQETIALALEGTSIEPRVDEKLYSGGAGDYVAAAKTDAACTLVVGHNPSIEQAVGLLGGRPVSMGTACAACFEDGVLVHFQRAQALTAGRSR